MVSLKDVAKAAGVGTTTVSVILNTPDKAQRFSKKTIEHVRAVARQLNYHANYQAQMLRSGKTYTIGVQIEAKANQSLVGAPWWSMLTGGIHRGLQKYNYQLTLISRQAQESALEIGSRYLKENRIDGLIVSDPPDNILSALEKKFFPATIILDRPEIKDLAGIYCDDTIAVELALNYLSSKNHKHILWHSPKKWYDVSPERRATAVADFCDKHQLTPGYCRFDIDLYGGRMSRDLLISTAEHELLQRLEKDDRITAVLCYNEDCALGAYQAIEKINKKVGQDISVISLENTFGVYLRPRLTCVDMMRFQCGEMAGEMIVKNLEKKALERASEASQLLIQPQIRERESVHPIEA